jgi:Xaa-Pro aminopeptidase
MVLTVEPGVYLADENLGVRIEDDCLVTASGCELLSGGAPRAAAAVESMMRKDGSDAIR